MCHCYLWTWAVRATTDQRLAGPRPTLQAIPRGVAFPPADWEDTPAQTTLLVLEYCDSGNLQVGARRAGEGNSMDVKLWQENHPGALHRTPCAFSRSCCCTRPPLAVPLPTGWHLHAATGCHLLQLS
jgi:hypothetical protein